MNITLTGNLGSGKGSVSEIFKSWGFGYVSGGDLFRGVAKEKGLTVIEMNELAKKDRTIDDMIDARSTRLGDELDHTLFDSRLAWHFVRESFKVFLLVDTDESARRVYSGNSREMENYASMEDCADGLSVRANLERDRFRHLYDIDYYDMHNYDLIIESTNATPEQIAAEILRNYEEYQKEKFSTRIELNLKALYPQLEANEEIIREYAKMRQEASAPKTLVAEIPADVISVNGYHYLASNEPYFASQIAMGKVFTYVRSFKKASESEILLPSRESVNKMEEALDFRFRTYPQDKAIKHDYMMDLSC